MKRERLRKGYLARHNEWKWHKITWKSKRRWREKMLPLPYMKRATAKTLLRVSVPDTPLYPRHYYNHRTYIFKGINR
jgi:hypothetical protein